MVKLMCNRTFENKDPNEAMKYLDLLAENAQNWDTTGSYEAPGKTQPYTSSGGMYNLREYHDLQAKFASLARKVEALEFKKNGQLKSVQDIVCQICETNEHTTIDCLTLPFFKECLHEQAHVLNSFQRPSHNPYSQTYNPNNGVVTIMHKLHSHRFKHPIISKILMDIHLLMLHLLEEILRKHCIYSLKSRRQSTLKMLKPWQI